MQYGLITTLDCKVLDKTLELVCLKFPEGVINTLELGVRDGSGSRGIRNFFLEKGRQINHTGIDNQNDMPIKEPFPGCNLIIGSSIEVYNKVPDNSQHFIFIDANHSYLYTMADFLLYSDKVVPGGYMAMHDTAAHIKPLTDYQRVGSNLDPDNYISCRKAIKKLGLLDNKFEGWQLIFDEADETKLTGGVTVIERIK
jgi:hypothetical protein